MSRYIPEYKSIIEILPLHDQHSHATPLAAVFGDGYMYAHSTIFKRIRDLILHSNISFAPEDSDFNKNYLNSPLFFINEIYKERMIPWKSNVKTIRYLNANYNMSSHVQQNVETPLTHESMHLIVNDYYGGLPPDFKQHPSTTELTLQLLAGESAANTFEFLIAHENIDPNYLSIAQFNIYVNSTLSKICAMKVLKEVIPNKLIFKVIYLSYFFSNFQFAENIPSQELKTKIIAYLNLASLNPYYIFLLEQIMEETYRLNRLFVSYTTSFYIKMIGGPADLKELYSFDVDDWVFNKSYLESLMEYLSDNLLGQEAK